MCNIKSELEKKRESDAKLIFIDQVLSLMTEKLIKLAMS